MSTDEENEIIVREFKRIGRRRIVQLLKDIQAKLTRRSGWFPPTSQIIGRAERLGIAVKWKGA